MIFKLNIEETLRKLLQQEDTDGDKKITIEDKGPRAFKIISKKGEDYIVKGTYQLSNLLQELVISKNEGNIVAEIPLTKIDEQPVNRISRMIRDYYWNGLTRRIDEFGVGNLIADTKNESLTAERLPIYIPFHDELALNYYKKLETKLPIQACRLPEDISPQYVKSLNNKPGILSLKLEENQGVIKGVPFVVPGGRFNEMYGWDSYFESVGLLLDGKVDLAKAMADNFQYEIEHYGKILNANRSYYLTRTQPPFYSSLIREVFEVTKDKEWLKSHLETAIKEYETVWMVDGKRLTENGLNRYLAEGIGITPEVEEGHYDAILKPFADDANSTIEEYINMYQNNEIENDFLDTYFLHDRTVRESGHDTSYRIEGNCADLNLVELNVLLYKYELDFAELIKNEFENSFEGNSKVYTSEFWLEKANSRKQLINDFCWNDETGLYVDYNHVTKSKSTFVSATTFAPLWGNVASKEQAKTLVKNALPLLKEKGGIAGSTKESRGEITESRPHRQWDYPNGWAPHQMMIWKGLINYGFVEELQELIYRWLYMITRNAVDYNGTIPEKYDVVEATHKVFAEYGNVGTDFEYISQEGFGWMNASYQYGLSLLENEYIEKLNQLVEPDIIF
ncbi:alpha,alpha-trehalase [Flaviramulus sp. BrNp1-15]|uniref:alpha,alpha-trehalase n=1 Tax=Flaviramulus sp. BrNp1-15 TaxID=2916754 RepID=UPI001EE8116A|nr:alpha,alpha-trehalase [Flaviramulus sp. BrNp1-15]ULC59052.1 alpha,alpha-trehalase [Flaviramulus sp. BrNp1-15]